MTHGTGSNYADGILGHDDILKVGPTLIADRPLLRTLVARRFPYIFVDESQDTHPTVVNALRQIAQQSCHGFCLGFFGDPMQTIYTTGAGPIILGDGWKLITKPENFRCPTSVLRVINQIRADDDCLEHVRGRTIDRDGIVTPVEGSAQLFILPADTRRSERLAEVRRWLSHANEDPLWESDGDDGDVRVLVLVHRIAAQRLGFADIYTALNDHGETSLKDGLLDGTAWVLRPFMTYLLPLVLAVRAGADFDVFASLRKHCPLLEKERLPDQNVAELLVRLKADVDRLVAMLNDGLNVAIRDVLAFVHTTELTRIDERFLPFLSDATRTADEADGDGEDASVNAFLACPAEQLWSYRTYIEDQSPFAIQQGVKGAEFQRVLVILDDEESNHNQFSYGKYFGFTDISDKDRANIRAGLDSVIERTRRLFYVCCSRAKQNLAVVLFVPDVRTARAVVAAKGLFEPQHVHVLP